MRIVPITKDFPDLHHVLSLYKTAFPRKERDPVSHLLIHDSDSCDFIAFYDGDCFCGFAYLLTNRDITHILYFAIDDSLRDKGYGAEALREMQLLRPGNRFLADLEEELPEAPNNEQRKKRKAFYQRNGFTETGIHYRWHQESYEILCFGGGVTEKEFDEFWHHFEKEDSMGAFLYNAFKCKV